jgi:aspartate dehydrogenase
LKIVFKKKLKIGIVGCGAIGTSLAMIAQKRFKARVDVAAICDRDQARALRLHKRLPSARVLSLGRLIASCDLVIEAASAASSFDIAKKALQKKRDVLLMSVGGVLGKEKKLFRIARENKKNIYFPSGAICGLDGVKALALAGIDEIILRTYKPPEALKGADYIVKKGIDVDDIRTEKLVFQGDARAATKAFPQNINVVALLSLAARGQVVPFVQIFVSPRLKRNVHVIEVKSRAARVEIRCENVPSEDNPKTSKLAILSALTTLDGICDVVRIGS